jgi:hypothetical protein
VIVQLPLLGHEAWSAERLVYSCGELRSVHYCGLTQGSIGMKKQYLAGIAAFNQEAARLHALMDQDPRRQSRRRAPCRRTRRSVRCFSRV